MYCSKCGALLAEGAAFCQTCGAPTDALSSMPGSVAIGSSPAALGSRPIYAGFWLRLVAYFIDGVVIGVAALIFYAIALGVTGTAGVIISHIGEPPDHWIPLIGLPLILGVALVLVAGTWLYYAKMESSSWQATLGKRTLGLLVSDLQGRRVSFGRATGRYFSKFITNLIPLAIGYILAGFTEKKQALHDMIAGCLVLRKI